MVVVRGYRSIIPYHAQRVALFWRSMMTLQRSGAPLKAQALIPSGITYKPKISSIILQRESNGAGARQEGGVSNGGTDTVGESQGGSGWPVTRTARLVGQPVQVQVPAESRSDVSAHGFWKQGPPLCLTFELPTSMWAPTYSSHNCV